MASLNLTQLYEKFRPGAEPPKDWGRDRDWAVDLIPKLIMANGELTQMLVHTDVTRYLEFKQIAASYVYRDGKIAKVPATEMEAVRSSLMGLFEKRRAKKFFEFIQNWRDNDPATHQTLDLDADPWSRCLTTLVSSPAPRTLSDIRWPSTSTTRTFSVQLARPTTASSSTPRPWPATASRPTSTRSTASASCPRPLRVSRPSTAVRTCSTSPSTKSSSTRTRASFVGVRSGDETVKADMVIGDPSYFRSGRQRQG